MAAVANPKHEDHSTEKSADRRFSDYDRAAQRMRYERLKLVRRRSRWTHYTIGDVVWMIKQWSGRHSAR